MKTLKTNRSNHQKVIFAFLFMSALFREGHLSAEPFKVDPSNRHVFTYHGKPVSLFGTYHQAMFSWAGWDRDGGWHSNWSYKDWRRFVDDASSKKNNVVRLWINWHGEVFRRTGPGTAHDGRLKYDLTQIDDAFSKKLKDYVSYAERKGIILQLILFDGWITKRTGDFYPKYHAFAAGNNINGLSVPGNQFFTLKNAAATKAQDLFVRTVIDTINRYDNWFLETHNEGGKGDWVKPKWVEHVVCLTKSYESGKPKQHLVGHEPGYGGIDPFTNRSIDVYTRAVSQTNTNHEQVHSALLKAYNNSKRNLPSFYDSDGSGDKAPGRQHELRKNAWAAFTAGGHVNFIYSDGDVPRLRNYIRHLQTFKEGIEWVKMSPNDALVTGGYALANVGKEYAVYLPGGGEASVDLSAASSEFVAKWFDPRTGKLTDAGHVKGGAIVRFTAPDKKDWALWLTRKAGTEQSRAARRRVGGIGVSPSGHYATYMDKTLMLIGDSGTHCAFASGPNRRSINGSEKWPRWSASTNCSPHLSSLLRFSLSPRSA